MNSSLLNWLLFTTLVLVWGTSFMVTTLAIGSFNPLDIAASRVLLGALVLGLVVYYRGLKLPWGWDAWWRLLLLGLVGNVLPFFLIAWGQQSVPSSTAGVLMAVMPLITMLLAHFTVAGERLNRFKILGFSISFSALVVLLDPSLSSQLTAQLAILLAASCYALNTVLVRLLSYFDPLVGGAGMLVGASIIALPLALFDGLPDWQSASFESVAALLWLALVPTGVASLVYFSLIERAGPSFLANINFVIPVVALFSGAWLLDETISAQGLICAAAILVGIAVTRVKVRS